MRKIASYFSAMPSPSPRRAWIEIFVDKSDYCYSVSPSPRRAWIEIMLLRTARKRSRVALPTEGVD